MRHELKASDLAREYLQAIATLNIPGVMMSTHDRGKEVMARAIIALADAQEALVRANEGYEGSDNQSTDWQEVMRAEERIIGLLEDL